MYTIKKLEWETHKNHDGTKCIQARGLDRLYEVDSNGPIKIFVKSFCDYIYKEMTQKFDSVDVAKLFAQKHFEKQVIKFLNVPDNSKNKD